MTGIKHEVPSSGLTIKVDEADSARTSEVHICNNLSFEKT